MRSIVSRPRAASRRSPLAVIDPSGNASAAATLNRIGSLSAISACVMLAERRTILFSGPDLPALSRRRLFLRQKLLVRVPVGGRVIVRNRKRIGGAYAIRTLPDLCLGIVSEGL